MASPGLAPRALRYRPSLGLTDSLSTCTGPGRKMPTGVPDEAGAGGPSMGGRTPPHAEPGGDRARQACRR